VEQNHLIRERTTLEAELRLRLGDKVVKVYADCPYSLLPANSLTVRPATAWARTETPRAGVRFLWEVHNMLPHPAAGSVRVTVPAGWSSDGETFAIETEDGKADGTVTVFPPASGREGRYPCVVTTGADTAETVVSLIRATLPAGLRIGIVRAQDTTLARAAMWLGAHVTELDSGMLTEGDLSGFHTIILDSRTYLLRPDLRQAAPRLLQWAEAGGHLIVFYQADRDWDSRLAPYPIRLSRARVADETAPVTVIDAHSVLFNRPNIVSESDWSGWKQERGLLFPGEADERYKRLVLMADPGEPPRDTGILFADTGRGSYLYTCLVWYRQLRDGHPGAFRMFANMIAYPLVR
jgi:hypothetical protein